MAENLKVRNFKRAIRDLKNKITGQQELIDEYNVITAKIAKASSKEPGKTARKAELLEAYHILEEDKFISEEEQSSFNPYTASKRTVKAKVELGRNLLNQLGLEK